MLRSWRIDDGPELTDGNADGLSDGLELPVGIELGCDEGKALKVGLVDGVPEGDADGVAEGTLDGESIPLLQMTSSVTAPSPSRYTQRRRAAMTLTGTSCTALFPNPTKLMRVGAFPHTIFS